MNLVIRNGLVIDGTGNTWFKADVGIEEDRIEKIGDLCGTEAERVIDVEGLVVSPGFIDVHAHTDYQLFTVPKADSRVAQGVTTDVSGNCGFSAAPQGKKWQVDWWVADKPKDKEGETIWVAPWARANEICREELGFEISWRTVDEYLAQLEKKGIGTNYCHLVGHHVLRAAVTEDVIRKPSENELEEMKALLDEAMREGAFGVSCGFDIKHEVDTREFIELGRVVAKYGGFFANHIRSLDDEVVQAVEEAIEIAEKAGVKTTISHLLVSGITNWGKARTAIGMIDEARTRGLEIYLDQIPFRVGEGNFFSPDLDRFLPEWLWEEGGEGVVEQLRDPEIRNKVKEEMKQGITNKWFTSKRYPLKVEPSRKLWENMLTITFCDKNKSFEGKNIAEIADEMGVDPYDAILNLLVSEELKVKAARFNVCEEDLQTIMRYPMTMFGSDGGIVEAIKRPGIPNPRQYGTFPRVLSKYVREKKILTLEDAIRRMTSLPAQFLGLRDRGLLREGMYADINVFDPKAILDRSSVTERPVKYAEGIEYTLVNGEIVMERGKHTGVLVGKVLRHGK